MENVRKCRDIKIMGKGEENYLVSEPNFCVTRFFTENLLEIEMKKRKYE